MVADRLLDVADATRLARFDCVAAFALGDIEQEVREYATSVLRQVHFRMELHAVDVLVLVGDR